MNNSNYDYNNMYYPYMPYDKKKGLYYSYQSTPVQILKQDNDGMEEMDIEYMKKMYPELARQIQAYIDEECDKMEYDGSYMYDEYPDGEVINMIVDKVLEKLQEDSQMSVEEIETESIEKDIDAQNYRYGFGGRGLRDLIAVMLLNEMFGRRRRYYRRRRPYYRRPRYDDYNYYY